jgi:ABC-type glycerol-3-phosphate transport system substrate-binding protein
MRSPCCSRGRSLRYSARSKAERRRGSAACLNSRGAQRTSLVKKLTSNLVLAFLVIGAAIILAFGPRPNMDAPPDRVRIQYWDKWTGLEGEQMKQIVDAFNDTVGKEKGIWVDFVSMSQIDRKIQVSIAGGVPPDVAGLWDSQVQEFSAMNALEPLGPYVDAAGLTEDKYKKVYYEGCKYHGKLFALPSTVWCVALLWNKEIFQEKAAELQAAGLDPDRAPRSIDELDRYAEVIDTWETRGGSKHLVRTGYIPLEAGLATNYTAFWFGGSICDPTGTKMLLLEPAVFNAYNWIRSYSERLGKEELAEFRSGFNSGAIGMFDTPQNPFLQGWNSMEQQGPWISAFIEKLAPSWNRWHVPPDQLKREKDFVNVARDMTQDQVEALLGPGDDPKNGMTPPPPAADGATTLHWLAGIKDLYVTFVNGKVDSMQARLLPAKVRQKYCQWGAAPSPSAVPGLENVTYAGMDVWAIPSTARHKKEAFEFIKFASAQPQIEKLSELHCNLSPLAVESPEYLRDHPNPYVDVYEELAASPNARPQPKLVNWPQIFDELTQVSERESLLQGNTQEILTEAQTRCQTELNKALGVPEDTNLGNKAEKP